jgi:diaminopimelate decarboxylase
VSTLAADAGMRTIGYGPDGRLRVEDVAAEELAERFGTPCYVVSEAQLRLNYRRLYTAFASRYPEVRIGYGVKAHNSTAVLMVLAQEGCGAECFGIGEMTVCERAGVTGDRVWVNGSDKRDGELRQSVRSGYTINVDNPEELVRLRAVAERERLVAKINLRVKLPLQGLGDVRMQDYRYVPPEVRLTAWARDHKFGMTGEEALACCRLALESPALDLRGLHHHLKGQTSSAAYFGESTRELIEIAAALRAETGWTPREVDLGGGFSYGRPEGYGPAARDTEVPSLDEYASVVTGALKDACAAAGMPLPDMVLEPGRWLVASASLLLTTVGTVKRQGRRAWVHVDSSINHLIRVYTGNWYYHIVPVTEARDGETEVVDVVGPLCDAADVLGRDRRLPPLARGDVLAVLDVGAYAESAASSFNTQPRPLSAMVRGAGAAVMTERESLDGMLSRQRVPDWLAAG